MAPCSARVLVLAALLAVRGRAQVPCDQADTYGAAQTGALEVSAWWSGGCTGTVYVDGTAALSAAASPVALSGLSLNIHTIQLRDSGGVLVFSLTVPVVPWPAPAADGGVVPLLITNPTTTDGASAVFRRQLEGFQCRIQGGAVCAPGHAATASFAACSSRCPADTFLVACQCEPTTPAGTFALLNMKVTCPVPERCAGNNTCALGFDGELCTTCGAGRYTTPDGECVACPSTPHAFNATIVLGILGTLVVAAAVYRFRVQPIVRNVTARGRALLSLREILPGEWPTTFAWFLVLPSIQFLRFEDTDAACTWGDAATSTSLLLGVYGPAIAWVLCALVALAGKCCGVNVEGDQGDGEREGKGTGADQWAGEGHTVIHTNPLSSRPGAPKLPSRSPFAKFFASVAALAYSMTVLQAPSLMTSLGSRVVLMDPPALYVNETGVAYAADDTNTVLYSFLPGSVQLYGEVALPSLEVNGTAQYTIRAPGYETYYAAASVAITMLLVVAFVYLMADCAPCLCCCFRSARESKLSPRQKWERWTRIIEVGLGTPMAVVAGVASRESARGNRSQAVAYYAIMLLIMALYHALLNVDAVCACYCCCRLCRVAVGSRANEDPDHAPACCCRGRRASPCSNDVRVSMVEGMGMALRDSISDLGLAAVTGLLLVYDSQAAGLTTAGRNALGVACLAAVLLPWISNGAVLFGQRDMSARLFLGFAAASAASFAIALAVGLA